MTANSPIAAWTDSLPDGIRKHVEGVPSTVITIVVAVLGVIVVAWMAAKVWKLFASNKTAKTKEQREVLAQLPPPPPPGARHLIIDGTPVRARLVTVAPVSRDMILNEQNLLPILEGVIPGLGEVVSADRPKLVIWPQQLSIQGFAPTFHRLTEKPEPDGHASRWVVVAGPATSGSNKILLGMAFEADKPCLIGRRTIQPERWQDVMRTEKT